MPRILTQAVDSLIVEVGTGLDTSGWAVVATGGYGRSEMCLQSDIDIMILGHPAPHVVRQMFYPLWDTGIKVGHSVRSVKEAVSGAVENIETLCSLLSARLVHGDQEPLDQLERQLSLLLRRQRTFLDLLAEEERGVREREPFFLQEMDVKTGRGGLRSVHRLDWIRRRDQLVGEPSGVDQLSEERAVLLGVRNALHATQGRGAERLAVDLRDTVAGWLEKDSFAMCGEVYEAARQVDDVLMARWPPGQVIEFDPVARAGRQLVSAVRKRRQESLGAATTPLPWALMNLDRPAPSTRAWGAQTATGWTLEDRAALVELLGAGRGGWDAYRQIEEWGRMALPELTAVTSLPQTAPFHSHPVDSHLWRTVDEVVLLTDGANDWCVERADDLGSLDELLLAAWLHDIGKGRSGDHAVIGAGLARDLLSRVGYGARTVAMVARAVELHLLLPSVATRQDLDDPAVIRSTAERIEEPELLSILAVLSVADARATGPAVWSDWTETLVRTLVGKLTVEMEGGSLEVVDAEMEPVLAEHVASMSPGYLRRFGLGMSRIHLDLAIPPPVGNEVRVEAMGDDAIPTVVVVAHDRPGLLAIVAGVFSLHGLNVLEARIATRSDGVAIDTFRVENVLGSLRVVPADWQLIEQDLGGALAGDLDVEARLVAKASAYTTPSVESRVTIEFGSEEWKVTVRGPDRVGLLHDLAKELTDAGIGISMAKVTTRGSQVVDVFSVSPGRVTAESLVDRLASVVEGR
ncbi:MAG: HD domain-containing protein [Actinomycetota bacterium]|nr:HD domain-containing protein [Actinomycetota bacterium]